MKATFFTIFAALAASAIAAPFQTVASSSNALVQPHRAVTMKRSQFKNSELLKPAMVGANNKRADDTAEAVIGSGVKNDAYQDAVDAVTDPASVLGKRANDIESVIDPIIKNDAYQDAVDAVADPASVLGKRADDIESVINPITKNEAYQDAVDAVSNPAEVLG